MARIYNWQRSGWPRLYYRAADLLEALSDARRKQGAFSVAIDQIGFDQQDTAFLDTLTTDAIETSEIEGQHVDYAAVRSSVAERLGMPEAAIAATDAKAAGIAEMVVDATTNYQRPLTAERLFVWHTGLFPGGRSEGKQITVGTWRAGSMGVYSRSKKDGTPITHFLAPPADRVASEMNAFLEWFARPHDDGLIRSGLAHLWFVTVHPFEDGNGRIARAIADMALAQDDKSSRRFFSMSKQIRIEQKAYYDILEATQSGDLDVTDWLIWFLRCYANAVDGAHTTLASVLRASRFWASHAAVNFNERHRKVLRMVFHGYEGNITSKNWARLTGASKETAVRDIAELVGQNVLQPQGAGRSTHYQLLEHGRSSSGAGAAIAPPDVTPNPRG